MVLLVSSSLKRLDLRSKGLIHHFSNLFAYITEISGGIIIKGGYFIMYSVILLKKETAKLSEVSTTEKP